MVNTSSAHTFDMESLAKDVHSFWFEDSLTNAESIPRQMQRWYQSKHGVDEAIDKRFSQWIPHCCLLAPADFANPEQLLCAVIVLDQFSRNTFRRQAKAFSFDPHALAFSQVAIAKKWDRDLHVVQRNFLYMPYQHSEDLAVQDHSIELFNALVNEAEPPYKRFAEGSLEYAHKHREIIHRFGRFPHRNKILARESTREEQEYLQGDAPTFGQ